MDRIFGHGLLIGLLLTTIQPAFAQGINQPPIGQSNVVVQAPASASPAATNPAPSDQTNGNPQSSDVTWFPIFNVSNKKLPGSYYAYSIVPATGSPQNCISPCQQLTLPEQRDGVSPIPASCFMPNCSLYLNIFLQGKSAGPSCQNIDLTNISEVWIYFNSDRFSAACQAFYPPPPAIPGGGMLPVGGLLPVGGALPAAVNTAQPAAAPATATPAVPTQ